MMLKPFNRGDYRRYDYAVITSTPHQKAIDTRCYFDGFYVGQIVIVDTTMGYPIEVGSGAKPGNLDCACEVWEREIDAIEFALLLWDHYTPDAAKEEMKRRRERGKGNSRRTKGKGRKR